MTLHEAIVGLIAEGYTFKSLSTSVLVLEDSNGQEKTFFNPYPDEFVPDAAIKHAWRFLYPQKRKFKHVFLRADGRQYKLIWAGKKFDWFIFLDGSKKWINIKEYMISSKHLFKGYKEIHRVR